MIQDVPGQTLRNGFFYLIVAAIDAFSVAILAAPLSMNLQLTRDYLVSIYNRDIDANRWLPLYQPLLAIQYIIVHPSLIIQALRDIVYTSNKYTTYIISVTATLCAVIPGFVHMFAALFIVTMAVFHNGMKYIVSFVLARMYEQKTFKFLTAAFGFPLLCIKAWDLIFSK